MKVNLTDVVEYPEQFYGNVLKGLDEVLCSDSCIYLSVLHFLVSTKNKQEDNCGQIINEYIYNHKNKILEDINAVKKSSIENDKELIRLCERHPIIRDMIYNEEKEELKNCRDEKDYIDYLNKFEDSCREFTLSAKYEIARLTDQNDSISEIISEAINSYPNSDVLDIEGFKKLCVNINGISICFKCETTEVQKDTIVDIIRDASRGNVSSILITNTPLSKLQILNLLKYDAESLQAVVTDINELNYLNRKDAEHILSILSKLTGLIWTFPHRELVLENEVLAKYENKVWFDNYNKSDSSIVTYYALQPIIKTNK